MSNITELKKKLVNLIKGIENKDWERCDICIQFSPTINKGFKIRQFFFDIDNNKVDIFFWPDKELEDILYSFIFIINQAEKVNQIILKSKRNNLEEESLVIEFNQEIEDAFQNNLPKSKKGKTIPWWKNPEETKGLI